MRKFCLVSTAVLTLLLCGVSNAQDFSNRGREFWLAYSFHVGMVNGGGSPVMTLYITSDVTTPYTVENFGVAPIASGTITAGQVVTVDIPTSCFINNEGLFSNKAIRVTAEKPVVVYSYITRSAASGATLALPTTVLGRDYVSMNYTQISNENNSHSYFTIVAVENNTTVEITPSANTKNGWLANSTYTVALNKGEIYQVLGTVNGGTGVDLTGSTIKSVASAAGACKKIAVFSGSGKISIGCGGPGSSDNLYQQLYPTATWGKKYLTAPSYQRVNNIFRVARKDPASNVFVNGALIPSTSFVNNVYEFNSATPNRIESDQPISVAQYFTTQGCFNNASPYDPDMILLNPVEQNISKVTLVSSNLAATQRRQHHLHVIIKNTGTAIASFRLDGVNVPTTDWLPHPTDPSYSYIYLHDVAQGYHTLSSDSGFNALAYGYADAETYGYSAGSNIKDLYQFITINNRYASVNIPAACRNQPFTFSMTFPYQPTTVSWQFNGLFPDTTIVAPVFTETTVLDGRTLYKYTVTRDYVAPPSGIYPIRIIAQNPTGDGCSSLQEIDYDLQVYDPPKADFNFVTDGCVSSPVSFTDNSTNNSGRPILHRYWDLADGTLLKDTLSFNHNYTQGGNYSVKYTVISDLGCKADTAFKAVLLNDPPVANFSIPVPACTGKTMIFTNLSTAPAGSALVKWTWDFGDGTPVLIHTNPVNPVHTYLSTGNFTVTLQVQSNKGCISTVLSKAITINAAPDAKFSAPSVCVNDLTAPFKDESTIPSGNIATWSWNFGDANATAGNPNTALTQQATHHYTLPGNYTAQLIAVSIAGCSDTVDHVVTVNGAIVTPAFTIENGAGNNVCSNKDILLKDGSGVDAGKLIRVEIFWDATNPADKTVDSSPAKGKIYSHLYPVFTTPASKTVSVRFDAYSGISCVNSTTQSITLLATPAIAMDASLPMCSNADPVLLSARVINSMQGTGVFTGRGVTASGLFTPQQAGSGVHNLTYTFTGTNGCSSSATKTMIIDPTPQANAGSDKVVLEGGIVELTPKLISAIPVSYLWTPSTSLNDPEIPNVKSSPDEDITYKLTVTSDKGCTTNDDVFVKVLRTPIIPNIFSPNGDGVHDRWEIRYLESYPGCVIQIYNRYGQMVWRIENYNASRGWDGKINGRDAPVATYYYIIEPGSGRKPITGFVDIIR
jgi:gliding motility-associated-like protein